MNQPIDRYILDLRAFPEALRADLEHFLATAPAGAAVPVGKGASMDERHSLSGAEHAEARLAMSVLLSQWRNAYQRLRDAQSAVEEGGVMEPFESLPGELQRHLEALDAATARGYPLPSAN